MNNTYMLAYCYKTQIFSFETIVKQETLTFGNLCFASKKKIKDFTWNDYKDLMSNIKKKLNIEEEIIILNIFPIKYDKNEQKEVEEQCTEKRKRK